MQEADVLGDETPDINQVFTMYGIAERKENNTGGPPSLNITDAQARLPHSPSPFLIGSRTPSIASPVDGNPLATTMGLPTSFSPRPLAERRQRERDPTETIRSPSYSSLAPAPHTRRSSERDGYPRPEIESPDETFQTQGLFTHEARIFPSHQTFGADDGGQILPHSPHIVREALSPALRSSAASPQLAAPTGPLEYGLSRNPSVSSVGCHYTPSYSPSLTDEHYQGQALELADEGQSKTIDANRVAQWGGVEQLGSRLRNEVSGYFDGGVMEDLRGSTHVLLGTLSNPHAVASLMNVLLPIIEDTLVVLDIHANMLREIPEALSRCRALEELNISDNPIPSAPKWLGHLTELRVVLMDNCSLRTLPATMIAAQRLHTICIRHNRLICLPPWLSQLPRLETLLIEGNPFVGPWKTLSQTLTSSATQDTPSFVLQEHDKHTEMTHNAVTLRSPNSGSVGPIDMPSSAEVSSSHDLGATHVESSGMQQNGRDLELDRNHTGDRNPLGNPSLRRMQSAGALLGLRSLSGGQVPTRRDAYNSGMSGQSHQRLDPPSTGLDLPFSDDEDDMELLSAPAEEIPSVAEEARQKDNKAGKWGFLRKMSMNRMRPATTVPKQGTSHAEAKRLVTRESGKTLKKMQSLASMPAAGHSERSISNEQNSRGPLSYQRGKRRSFLPVLDGPPSLNVAIPSFSSSPFSMSTLSLHSLPLGEGTRDIAQGNPEAPSSSAPGSSLTHSHPPSTEQRRMLVSSATSYETGLKTIMSYLGDLYDLFLPVPAVQGGAEIVQGDLGTTSASVSGTSESRSGASSPQTTGNNHIGRTTPNAYKTTQYPGLTFSRDGSPIAPDSPATSDAQGGYDARSQSRPASVARVIDEEAMPVKRYKDDPVNRLGVIKHIIDTERTYVRGLQDLVDIYVKPASQLISKSDSETVVPANERKIVFGGLEGILQFHRQSFLPALEKAAGVSPGTVAVPKETDSQNTAMHVANVFKLYHPFMRQYSSYINNFDYALMRLRNWSDKTSLGGFSATSPAGSHDMVSPISAGALTAGLGIGNASGPQSTRTGLTVGLTIAQKKRIRSFLKHCRKHPRHSQLNLESYLLMPVQRIPRYRMLLEDLARCTPPMHLLTGEPIEDALQEMVALASTMNEEKRDSESRRKLVKWQQRIRGRFATPLVQAHRRLLLDGQLVITRNVKRSATLVEVPGSLLVDDSPDRTITNAKTVVQVETLVPEIMERPVLVLLASDMMLLCKDPSQGQDPDCPVELFAVLKLQTKANPASVINGNGIRLVDNRNILYLTASSKQEAMAWVTVINNEFDPTK